MDRGSLPVIVIVALVSGAIGWFAHTPPAALEATATSPTATSPGTSKPGAASASANSGAKVAAPTTAPAPVKNATVGSSSSASISAPAVVSSSTPVAAPITPGVTPPELVNVITELSTLASSGDIVGLYENYETPQKLAALTPEQKTFLEDQIRKQMEGPNGQKVIQQQVAIIQALNNVTPTMNSAGDHATFQVPTPKDIAPEGTNLPPTIPINFVKIDGKWYLDQ